MIEFRKIRNIIIGQIDNMRILVELAIISFLSSKTYHSSFIYNYSRGLYLARNAGFKPREAYETGLFNPTLSNEKFPEFVSKLEMSKIQARFNPGSWFWTTESKDVFYRICMSAGIPVPDIYALYYRRSFGWINDNRFITSKQEWCNFIDNELPDTFVVKPARGVYAHGMLILRRNQHCFVDACNNQMSSEDLFRSMEKNEKYDSYIIQERINNHPDIYSLNQNNYLQSLRVISFIDSANNFRILYAALKLITGKGFADNFAKGTAGNLKCKIDSATGRLSETIGPALDRPGLSYYEQHPVTGIKFCNFDIPYWNKVCNTVRHAAYVFLPIRLIGWDVAISPLGPIIIEANIRWDPPNQHLNMNEIIESLDL